MVLMKNGPETSHEERKQHRLHVVYKRQTHERQIFMNELKEIRREKELQIYKTMKNLIGPIWMQALSEPQRKALDMLEFCIYQDLLEGRPSRTHSVMKDLGLYPRPNPVDLMNCVYLGRDDPKEMLAQLFYMTYGHPVDIKRSSYGLNARLMLTGILYLGLQNLLELLKIRFRPDKEEKPPKPKLKSPKRPPLKSPYLQDLTAFLYLRPKRQPFRPAPLPNLDELNDPYEEEPTINKPPPPPPPPPPPKKRLARSYCDKLAGIINIEPYSTITTTQTVKTITQRNQIRRTKGSKMCVAVKKSYGMSVTRSKNDKRRRKLAAPNTGVTNSKYMINGVFTLHGKTAFILGNVTILPPEGELIHGGYKLLNGEFINIHCGFRGQPPPPKPDPCDCVKIWQDTVFKYVKENKCHCGHFYDYGNEGIFAPEELPYFQKATRFSPFQFNYHTIYNLDEKQLFVEKEFKRVWETDSALHVSDGAAVEKKDKKKKKVKHSSTTCLGQNPKPEDYLKCALRLMRRANKAACLPDVHLVPELKEWMRWRIYGPIDELGKRRLLRKSFMYWQIYGTLLNKDLEHVYPTSDPTYTGVTTWRYKQDLNDKFRKYTQKYKLNLYRSYANSSNLLWPTMCQAEFPNKKFREIYFSYLSSRVEDLQLMHPYATREAVERATTIGRKRYICKPDGAEDIE